MPILSKNLLSKIFPNYVKLFEQINNNVLFQNIISKHLKNCKSLPKRTKHDYFQSVHDDIIKNDAIDYLEFGVYEGGTILDWPNINTNPNSRFFAFDKFPPKYPVPKIDDKRVSFVKGMFHETLPDFLKNFVPKSRVVVFINLNKYPETLHCLTQLDSVLPSDSLIMFDQFGNLQGEFIAFYDYVKSYKRNYSFICQTENWRKVTVKLLDKQTMIKPSQKLQEYRITNNKPEIKTPKKKLM